MHQAQALECPASRVPVSGKNLQRLHLSESGANRFNGELKRLLILEQRKAVLERAVQLWAGADFAFAALQHSREYRTSLSFHLSVAPALRYAEQPSRGVVQVVSRRIALSFHAAAQSAASAYAKQKMPCPKSLLILAA